MSSEKTRVPHVFPCERETHLSYEPTSDVAKLITFEAGLARKALRAGGVLTHQGKTEPTYWMIDLPKDAVKIRIGRPPKRVYTEEQKAVMRDRLAAARK